MGASMSMKQSCPPMLEVRSSNVRFALIAYFPIYFLIVGYLLFSDVPLSEMDWRRFENHHGFTSAPVALFCAILTVGFIVFITARHIMSEGRVLAITDGWLRIHGREFARLTDIDQADSRSIKNAFGGALRLSNKSGKRKFVTLAWARQDDITQGTIREIMWIVGLPTDEVRRS